MNLPNARLVMPYPGLRPFTSEDQPLFFGREAQVSAMLRQLEDDRFVAVVGSSGSGKSSLVRAGLLPAIHEGFLLGSTNWLSLIFKPGSQPYQRLARELQRATRLDEKAAATSTNPPLNADEMSCVSTLRQTDRGLLEALTSSGISPQTNVMVVVDQFEELFAFRLANASRDDVASRDEAAAFVRMLLRSSSDPKARVWVILTMRSDFIGNCEAFLGLPEAVSRGQFLVPRLDRGQMEEAIRRPAEVTDAAFRPFTFETGLVNRMINDAGDRPDQLPLLQHALMRTWKFAVNRANGNGSAVTVSEDDYRKAGGIDKALSLHANAAWVTIANDKRKADIARHLFVLLCDVSPDGQITRRRPKIAEVEMVTGASIAEIEEVIRLFQDDDRNFLLPAHNEELCSETDLDVSHEALLRQWDVFAKDWLVQERSDADELRSLVKQANDRRRGKGGLLGEQDLIRIRDWKERSSLQWARRYVPAGMWNEALGFVQESEEEAERTREEELLRKAERERAREEELLRKAESERVKLLLEKRKRERIFGITVFLLGIIMLIAFAAVSLISYRAWQLSKQKAAGLEAQRRALVTKGKSLRENAKSVLASGTDNPLKDVTALRNLALAIDLNPNDTEAARLASNLLLQHVWCPPAALAVVYPKGALLAATFVPGGSNNEIFTVGGDGQLLYWNGEPSLSPKGSSFEKPTPVNPQQIVQPGFASFSPDGRWLLIIPPTLASATDGESAVQGAPSQGALRGGHEPCKIQIWRWSTQNRTYESAGEDLEIQRLRGSRINFAWSNESDQLVVINALGTNQAECAFFQVEGTLRELVDRSMQLTEMKIVALAFAAYHSGIAAVSLEPRGLRKVTLLKFSEEYLQVLPVNGAKDSILLAQGFQPNGIAFGPGNDEITLTSSSDIRILNFRDGKVTPMRPPTFRDQFMRIVVGPGDFARRLVATSLYGRVDVAKGARMQEPAEPAIFRGSIGIPQFSSDGQRLLIVSGGLVNVLDSMRLIDVSSLYRPQEAAPEKLEAKPAPPWLTELASAVSASDPSQDGSLITLQDVRRKYPASKAGDPYEAVWKRFFPDERTAH
jgi:energy-coupling factor transporter ATP-binding protein EcfA2